MPRDFDPNDDRPLLRNIVKRLGQAKGLTLGQLLRDLAKHAKLNPQYTPAEKGVLYRFINKNENVSRSIPQLTHLWDYLTSHTKYSDILLEEFGLQSNDSTSDSEFVDGQDASENLSRALASFFDHDLRAHNKTKMDSISAQIIGSYIMYRPDIRPVVEPLRANGLVRASRFDVFHLDGSLFCSESQSITRDKYGSANPQKNFGPLFAYQDHVFFLMRGETNHSLKFGVIEMMRENDGPMHWFRGSILVVSNFGTFPLVKFFCLRNDENHPEGILQLNEMPDEEVRAFIEKSINELIRDRH